MEEDDDYDNEDIDFNFQLGSFTSHTDVQPNLLCQEERHTSEHSAWRPSTSGSAGLTFENATPLLVNAGVGRGKSKVHQTTSHKGDVKSKVLKEIRAAREIEQENYSKSWNYITSNPRSNRDSADNSSYENDEIYVGGLSSDDTDKQGNQNKELCTRRKTCSTDDGLLDQLHKNNPKFSRDLLQRAIHMHSENLSGAYLGQFTSQNRKWMTVSVKIVEIAFISTIYKNDVH